VVIGVLVTVLAAFAVWLTREDKTQVTAAD
jgi:hypothetical protein